MSLPFNKTLMLLCLLSVFLAGLVAAALELEYNLPQWVYNSSFANF